MIEFGGLFRRTPHLLAGAADTNGDGAVRAGHGTMSQGGGGSSSWSGVAQGKMEESSYNGGWTEVSKGRKNSVSWSVLPPPPPSPHRPPLPPKLHLPFPAPL